MNNLFLLFAIAITLLISTTSFAADVPAPAQKAVTNPPASGDDEVTDGDEDMADAGDEGVVEEGDTQE